MYEWMTIKVRIEKQLLSKKKRIVRLILPIFLEIRWLISCKSFPSYDIFCSNIFSSRSFDIQFCIYFFTSSRSTVCIAQ